MPALAMLPLLATALALTADEPPSAPSRPALIEGVVVVHDRSYGAVKVRSYFLEVVPPPPEGRRRIPLILAAPELLELLERFESNHAVVRIKGSWGERDGLEYLLVKSITEVKP